MSPSSAQHRGSRDETLSRLHLHAVLPALAQLPEFSAEARELAATWKFSVSFALLGGPTVTISPVGNREGAAGELKVETGPTKGRGLKLVFLRPDHLNRTFARLPAPPPLPLGRVWLATRLQPFFKLSRLLEGFLQPDAAALQGATPEFLQAHLRLTLGVLVRAAPIVAGRDDFARAALSGVPAGTLELRAPTLPATAWLHWDGRDTLESGLGSAPSRPGQRGPDATLTFMDTATLADALHGRLDPAVAVGLGRLQVHGLVTLADALGVVMDRVETYLQP